MSKFWEFTRKNPGWTVLIIIVLLLSIENCLNAVVTGVAVGK